MASHCWANSFCARAPTTPVSTSATGITASAISESCQEIISIITSTPSTVRIEFTSPVKVFIRVFWMLSMSLVTRERISPRFIRSKYFSGRRCSFSSTSRRRRETIRTRIRFRATPCSHISSAETAKRPTARPRVW